MATTGGTGVGGATGQSGEAGGRAETGGTNTGGTNTGGTSTGGTSTGGSTNVSLCDSPVRAAGVTPMLVTFEGWTDQNLESFTTADGFAGGMYQYVDSSGSSSLHVTFNGYYSYAAATFRLMNYLDGGGFGVAVERCYDASVYSGVGFWVFGSPAPVTVSVGSEASIPVAEGGTCAQEPCPASTAPFTPGQFWRYVRFSWSDFSPPVDPSQITRLDFHLGRMFGSGQQTASVTIDSIQFVR
jgi:hypothetical protein